ncbi:MAG: FKBP-type peptidyl-prolyl cis-trans isomerase [Bacteroidales bacterium]|nr:FKBP-type peptidyl-prolyl cis-trans isomerase [Bacteroidales bacterium]
MKTNKFFAALLIGAAVVACGPKSAPVAEGEEAVKTAKDYQASKATIDSVSYLVGINFGSFIKGYDFGDLNYAQIKKGISDFVKAKGNFRDPEFNKQFKIDPELMNDLFNNYLEGRRNQKLLINKEAGEKFLAENAKKEGVQVSESGLQYIIVEPGNDVKAGPADTVWVNYKGTLLDGSVFDETPEGAEPIQMQLSRVIKGWTEGLQLVGEGGKIKLFIPSELAYGEQGNQGIEPNSTLIFDVEVSKVGKVPAEE